MRRRLRRKRGRGRAWRAQDTRRAPWTTAPRIGSRCDCLPVCALRCAGGRVIVVLMRRIALAFVVVSAAGCGKKKAEDKPKPEPPDNGSATAGSNKGSDELAHKDPPPPLPGLGKDPGDATGTPVWVTGFGGLAP